MKKVLLSAVLVLIIASTSYILYLKYQTVQVLAFQRFLPNELIRRANNPPHTPDEFEIKEVISIGKSRYGSCAATLYVCNDEKYGFCTYMEMNPRTKKEFAINREGPLPSLTELEINRIKQQSTKYIIR